jgi:hypothetical protein
MMEHTLCEPFGVAHRLPCASMLPLGIRPLDRETLEAKRGAYAAGFLGEAPRPEKIEDALTIAGLFLSVHEARHIINGREEDNSERPHRTLEDCHHGYVRRNATITLRGKSA